MGFSRREHWRGLPCPPPGGLPHPGIQPASPVSPALTEPPGKLRFIFSSFSHIHSQSSENQVQYSSKNISKNSTTAHLPIVTALVHDTHSSWLNDFKNTPPPICLPKLHTLSRVYSPPNIIVIILKSSLLFKFFGFFFFTLFLTAA